MAKAIKKAASKKAAGKRSLIAPKGDKRYIRRDSKGRITESDDQGKSLSQDAKRAAKKKAKPGYGDQGDGGKKVASKKGASKKAAGKKAGTKVGSKKSIVVGLFEWELTI